MNRKPHAVRVVSATPDGVVRTGHARVAAGRAALTAAPAPAGLEGWANCARCGLARVRCRVVFGRGQLPCAVCFIGIGPGASEDLIGAAFVGKSGRILNRAIADAGGAGLRLYFTNLLACLPADRPRGHFRDPEPAEVVACRPRLAATLALARPRRVIALGDVAHAGVKAVCPDAVKLHHPSYLLRTGGVGTAEYQDFVRGLEDVLAECGGV